MFFKEMFFLPNLCLYFFNQIFDCTMKKTYMKKNIFLKAIHLQFLLQNKFVNTNKIQK